MTDPWLFGSSLELGALPTAVPCACLHVRQILWEWGLNSLAESAELLVSELVTNAVNATAGRAVTLHQFPRNHQPMTRRSTPTAPAAQCTAWVSGPAGIRS